MYYSAFLPNNFISLDLISINRFNISFLCFDNWPKFWIFHAITAYRNQVYGSLFESANFVRPCWMV